VASDRVSLEKVILKRSECTASSRAAALHSAAPQPFLDFGIMGASRFELLFTCRRAKPHYKTATPMETLAVTYSALQAVFACL